MTSRTSLIALGIGAYLAFSIANFPASVAYRWFAPDALALAAVDGTIWRGSAAYGGLNGIAFSELEWQLQPAALVTGAVSLSAQMNIAGGLARSDVDLRGSRLTLSNVRASVSLAALDSLLPLNGVLGNLSVTLDELELIDGWPARASGTARVNGLAGPPLFPVQGVSILQLGNFSARLQSTDDGELIALVNDEGGPLELTDGQVSLRPDRSYRLAATIKPRADAHRVLVEGLEILSPANAAGQHVITDSGSL
jgi:general secretion pathway protein N